VWLVVKRGAPLSSAMQSKAESKNLCACCCNSYRTYCSLWGCLQQCLLAKNEACQCLYASTIQWTSVWTGPVHPCLCSTAPWTTKCKQAHDVLLLHLSFSPSQATSAATLAVEANPEGVFLRSAASTAALPGGGC